MEGIDRSTGHLEKSRTTPRLMIASRSRQNWRRVRVTSRCNTMSILFNSSNCMCATGVDAFACLFARNLARARASLVDTRQLLGIVTASASVHPSFSREYNAAYEMPSVLAQPKSVSVRPLWVIMRIAIRCSYCWCDVRSIVCGLNDTINKVVANWFCPKTEPCRYGVV